LLGQHFPSHPQQRWCWWCAPSWPWTSACMHSAGHIMVIDKEDGGHQHLWSSPGDTMQAWTWAWSVV
jgi:hypothetical protein